MTQQPEFSPRDIEYEKLRRLTQRLPQSIGFGMALALATVVILWRSQQWLPLLLWFGAHAALSAWRLRTLRVFNQAHNANRAAAEALARPIQLGCFASGVLWGLMAMFPYPPADLQVPLFVAFVLAGVTAAGASAMASHLMSALAFQWAVFAILALRLLVIENDATYFGMGMTALLYTLFMGAWTRRISINEVEAIRTQMLAQHREQQLQQREARYRELAHHDALTGLPNRLSLQARMPELLQRATSDGTKVAVIYIDLDHFKDINDSRGHRSGDLLLATTAARLRECVRPDDLVVRMGGDEFIVAAIDAQHTGHVDSLAARLAASIELPLTHEGEALATSASMGIAVFPDHGTDTDQLLKNADIALYQAKAAGRNNHQFFATEMSVAFGERIFLEQALARALGTSQMYLEFQPLIDLGSGRMTGLEALLRWNHPERGLVPPLTFIPIAEHCGLIEALGAQVLQQVCRHLNEWQRDGLALVPVAVNVSPRQFESGTLGTLLRDVAREHRVEPSLLQIEITETALMKGTIHEEVTLRQLRELGVKVLIDDFGIGYSSLNHLKSLSIDGLKIDRSFVRDMADDERDAAIVSAVIAIAKSLRIGVLAEGVESARHVEQLRAMGCDAGQGNFLHPPLSADQCRSLLQQLVRQPPAAVPPSVRLVPVAADADVDP